MKSSVKLALALWAILALAVFSVRFDWLTRLAGHQFVYAQVQRRAAGMPLETIEHGFRPMVRAAALESSKWLLLVVGVGTGAILLAARRQSKDA